MDLKFNCKLVYESTFGLSNIEGSLFFTQYFSIVDVELEGEMGMNGYINR